MDIMFQMMYDEKRFGLDKKQEVLYGRNVDDPMQKTRAKLLQQVEEDLAKARRLTKAPDFRLKAMQDLLAESMPKSKRDKMI